MLLEFFCANHKSIKDEILFSTVAGHSTALPEQLCSAGGLRVLRAAVIYGPNGSGKSNLLDAIACLHTWAAGTPVIQSPHKLAAGVPTRMTAQFLCGEVRFAYGLTLLESEVVEEYLYHFPRGRQVRLFERTGMAVTPGGNVREAIPAWTPPAPNQLLLADPAIEQVVPLAAARRFFAETIVPFRLDERFLVPDANLSKAISILREQPETRAGVLAILASLDTGILDLRIEGEDAFFVYPDFETDLRREESTGIRRLVSFLCPFVDLLRGERILLCDELETNLHEVVLRALLDRMRRSAAEKRAQLIFTTQNTSLLENNLFRRDQIWFTTLRPSDRSTDLYSLAEIRRIHEDEDLRRGYITGKYGGIPLPDRKEVEQDG